MKIIEVSGAVGISNESLSGNIEIKVEAMLPIGSMWLDENGVFYRCVEANSLGSFLGAKPVSTLLIYNTDMGKVFSIPKTLESYERL